MIYFSTIIETIKLNHLNDKVTRKQLMNYCTSNNIKIFFEAENIINL